MKTCSSCRRNLPFNSFRLIKDHDYAAPRMNSRCMDCEFGKSDNCGKCGRIITRFENWKFHKVFYCANCVEEQKRLKKLVIRLKLEKQIKTLIKKLDLMPRTINSLRDTLFQTIDGLKDGTIQVETAKQITETAKAIIDSCRVENEFIQVAGGIGSGFIPLTEQNLLDATTHP